MTKDLSRAVLIVSLLSVSTWLTATLDELSPEVQAQIVEKGFTGHPYSKTSDLYSQFRRAPRPSPQAPANNQKVYRTKIKRRAGGTPVVDVTFNGSKTFEMIVDTGASGTLITQSMATALRIKPIGKIKAGIANGSIAEFDLGRVQSISVGGAVVRNVEVAIAKQMGIGLLGHDFFQNYDIKIKKDVVEFYRRE